MTFNFECDSKPSKDGTYRIYLRITKDRKKIRERTDIKIKDKSLFKNEYGKWISKKHFGFEQINKELAKIIAHYQKHNLSSEQLYTRLQTFDKNVDLVDNSLRERLNKDTPFDKELDKTLVSIANLKEASTKVYISSFDYELFKRTIFLRNEINTLSKKFSDLKSFANQLIQKIDRFEKDKTELLSEYIKSLLIQLQKANKSIDYISHTKSDVKHFVKFAGDNIRLQDIDTKLINEYAIYLGNPEAFGKKISNNTVKDKIDSLSDVFKAAISDKIIKHNPVLGAKLPKSNPVVRGRLDAEQIKKIEKLDYSFETQRYLFLAKRMFLLSYYNAGIRIGDCIQLRFKNAKDERLEYQMGKTRHLKSILLNKKSKEIIEEMRSLVPNEPIDCIFGLLDRTMPYYQATDYESKKQLTYKDKRSLYYKYKNEASEIQAALKIIATDIEYNGRLTFHISRHSFATRAITAMKKGQATILDIKEALGHQDIRTTMGYLGEMDVESLDNAMKAIFEDE